MVTVREFLRPEAPADWERPGPTRREVGRDAIGALTWFVVGYLAWWFSNEIADSSKVPAWGAAIGLGVQCGLLALRRKYPLSSLLVATVVFIAVGYALPGLSYQLSLQAAYFASFYSAAAWARDTRAFRICATAILIAMALWLVVGSVISGAYEELSKSLPHHDGPLPPYVSWMVYSILVNAAYFTAALVFGRRARAGAWQRGTLQAQAEQLRAQSAELARRAVVDERLRIARELHDVVAHHISAVGIQAAAARRLQGHDPDKTAQLLSQVESSSRSALAETRALLGVLRSDPAEAPTEGSSASSPETPAVVPASRAPEPGLDELEDLVGQMRPDLQVELSRVEADDLSLDRVPKHLGLTVYRVVQEALTNVRRHSTARAASVAIRTGHDHRMGDWVEAEVLDTGRPRPTPRGPAGSGFGLTGVRERADLHQGTAEIGPRVGSPGFRVRLRVPLTRPPAAPRTSPTTTKEPS